MTITAQELVRKLQTEFPQILREADRNRDGTIDRCELQTLLMAKYCIPWACAANMVSEAFCTLDKNGDGRISVNEVQRVCECACKFVETIRLICPAEGTTFCHFPRTTFFSWTPMATAVDYRIEIQFQDRGCWVPLTTGHTCQPCYQAEFIGAQPGRWQVTAYDAQHNRLGQLEWRTFVYRV